jgi:hypothetical protein
MESSRLGIWGIYFPMKWIPLAVACALCLSLPARLAARGGLARPTGGHLAYFGFVGVDCGLDDPHDGSSKINYSDEVASFSNLAHLCLFAETEDLAPRLAGLHALGMRALVAIEPLLFDTLPDPSLPAGARTSLRFNYVARWSAFLAANAGSFTPESVAAIYLVDEPTWHGLPATDLALAANLIESTLPSLPCLVIEAGPAVAQLQVPVSVDWVGFDEYGTLDPKSDANYLHLMDTLEAKLTASQRVVLIPETQWLPAYAAAGVQPADMALVLRSYEALALARPKVIALIAYLWPGGLDEPAQLGARELPPSVQLAIQAVGRGITHK